MESDPAIEFSRIVAFDQIGTTGAAYHVDAKEEERRRLAERFQLVAIHHLSASFALSQAPEPGCYHIEGEVTGDVVQACVSTLEEVPAQVKVTVHILLRPSREGYRDEEFIIDLEDERDIEYYQEGFVDLGETAAQYLYLNLDPFPHVPNAPGFPEIPSEENPNPLAQALKKLKEE